MPAWAVLPPTSVHTLHAAMLTATRATWVFSVLPSCSGENPCEFPDINAEGVGALIKNLASHWEVRCQGLAHSRALASLAREQSDGGLEASPQVLVAGHRMRRPIRQEPRAMNTTTIPRSTDIASVFVTARSPTEAVIP